MIKSFDEMRFCNNLEISKKNNPFNQYQYSIYKNTINGLVVPSSVNDSEIDIGRKIFVIIRVPNNQRK